MVGRLKIRDGLWLRRRYESYVFPVSLQCGESSCKHVCLYVSACVYKCLYARKVDSPPSLLAQSPVSEAAELIEPHFLSLVRLPFPSFTHLSPAVTSMHVFFILSNPA